MNQGRRRAGTGIVALALALVSLPLWAGEKHKCTMDTQACLDKMAASLKDRGWIGIEMDEKKGASGLTITRVVPGSPAEAAGFRVGDLLVSVDGVRFADNTEDRCVTCAVTKENWVPGRKVHYVVARNGANLGIDPILGPMPTDVLAQWVGKHMLEHAQIEIAKK